MVLITLTKVLVVLVDHADEAIFDKFHSCDSSPLHPCRALASTAAVIFAGPFCPYQDVRLKEWYVPTAIHHDGAILGESVVQLPYHQNDVVASTVYTTNSEMI